MLKLTDIDNNDEIIINHHHIRSLRWVLPVDGDEDAMAITEITFSDDEVIYVVETPEEIQQIIRDWARSLWPPVA